MNEKHNKKISKFLSPVLRHQPEIINLNLDENGWADVKELQEKCANKNVLFTLDELNEVVETNDKNALFLMKIKLK